MLKIIIILLAATSIATVHAQVGTGSVSFQSSDSLFLQNTFQSQMQLMDSFIAIPMPQLGPYMQSQRNKKEIKKLQLIREALYPDGNINAALKADSIFMHQQTNTANRNSGCVNAAWQPVGPIGDPQGHPTQNKNGRLDCIAFKVSDPNTIYVGSGSGIVTLGGGAGLWKVNGTTGQAASMKTDKLTLHNGVAAIAPLSTGRVIIATGSAFAVQVPDFNVWEKACRGIYYTDDEGVSWNKATVTNKNNIDPFQYGENYDYMNFVSKIAVNPTNSNILYMTVYSMKVLYESDEKEFGALYKSTDAGATWQEVNDTNLANRFFQDVEFHPTNGNIIYLSGQKVYKSTNGGTSWSDITSRLTNLQAREVSQGLWLAYRIHLSVPVQGCSTADADHVVAILSSNTLMAANESFLLFHSSDAFSTNIASTITQFEASKVRWSIWHYGVAMTHDPNVIYVGGRIIQLSTNGGTSFATTHAYGFATHADHQQIGVPPFNGTNAGIVYSCTDGGLWKSLDSGTNFTAINNELMVNQFFSVATSQSDNSVLGGTMDNNNIRRRNDGTWHALEVGDGSDYVAINPNDPELYAWSDLLNRANSVAYYTRDQQNNVVFDVLYITPASSGKPFMYLKSEPNTFVCLTDKLYRVANGVTSTGNVFPGPVSNNIAVSFGYCESQPDIMYAATRGRWQDANGNLNNWGDPNSFSSFNFYRSDDGGDNWSEISTNLPGVRGEISGIAVHPYDPDKLWITFGGYSQMTANANQNAFVSSDGGQSWNNYSTGLPLGSTKDIVYHIGSNDKLFVAMDRGVYYRDANMSSWECFDTDLPSASITDLDINYCNGRLYAATFGRGIWSTNILQDPPPAAPTFVNETRPIPQEIITSSVTWNTSKRIYSGIKITNGATLTISGSGTTIHMPANGVILVDRGATLVVDSATITNSCEKCMWAGINLSGTSWQSQGNANSHPHQGRVVLQNGATLEHARTAISNWSLDDPAGQATSGGIIHATEANFINNGRSAEFIPYQNYGFGGIPISDGSFFRNCTFNITNDYKGLAVNYPFKHHVTMWDVSGVKFYGNTFKNEHTGNLRGLGDGIYSYNSGFNATRYPLNLSQSANAFLDLKQGISIDGDMRGMPKSVLIDRNDFDGTTIGIMISNVENVTAIRNSFSVGNGRGIELLDCHDNIGIYATNTAQFRIEENVFTESTPKTADYTIGTLIHHSGGNDKELYKNSYNGLDYGILATGKNRVPYIATYPAGNTGLRILCNSFTGNTNDVGVSGNNTAPNYEGIAMFQGSNALSAGNRFNTSTSTHFNNTASSITYYYGPNNSNVIPSNFLPAPPQQNVFPIQATQDNGCASKLGGEVVPEEPVKLKAQDKSSIKNVFYTNQATRNSKLAQWNNTIDGGNTQYVIDEIPNLPHGYAAMNFMLQYAPYSSEQVLRVLAENDVMDKEMLKEVLAANPDVLRGREFLDFIQSGSVLQPMDESDMDYLFTYIENVTARTILESEISHHQAQMSNAVNLLITDIKNDEEGAEIDSLPVWYDRVGEAWAQYERAYHFLYKDDFAGANAIFNAIPTAFNYGTSESVEHERLYTIFDLLNTLKSEDRSIYELGSDEIGILQDIRTASMLESHDIATSILAHTGIIDRFPCIDVYYPPASSMRQANRTATIKKSKPLLSVYPNPAKDYTVFEYTGKELASPIHVSVMNTMGQTVATVELKKGVATKTYWDTRALAAGNYFYQATDGKKKIGSGKFVITK